MPNVETIHAPYWETVATTRWGQHLTSIERRTILFAQELAGPPGEAFEIGCEGGRWSDMLARLGWKMTCSDINPDALQYCQKRLPAARCVLARPEDRGLPGADGAYSLLLCIEVNPVSDSDWFMAEAARVLRQGGVLVAVVLNAFSLRGAFVRLREAIWPKPGYRCYRHTYGAWRRRLLDHGFKVEGEEGFCWLPFSRASDSTLASALASFELRSGLGRLPRVSPWVAVVARKIKTT